MDRHGGEIVLLTGSSGFLGRHLLRQLLEEESVAQVRALDKIQLRLDKKDKDSIRESGKLKIYKRDLLDVEACREAFRDVDVVLHCAALVSYEYPADVKELRRNNVDATANVLKLCREEGVARLVHCSTTEVTLQSNSITDVKAVVIYKPESQLEVKGDGAGLIFGPYAASKLKAERLVLKADNEKLDNGKVLRTVALRPTILYGEGDSHLLPKVLQVAKCRGDRLPRLSGSNGKQQMTYVGNAAWAFLKAMKTLRENPEEIAGLPVNVTDDTLIEDLTRFCERVTKSTSSRITLSSWSLPTRLSYLAAWFVEFLTTFGITKFKIPPRGMIAYLGSTLLYSRARASIHMNYWPKYNNEQTCAIAARYYGEVYSNLEMTNAR